MTTHPTERTLGDFSLGKLADGEAEAVNGHLEDCEECRRRVAGMSPDSFLDRLRDAHQRPRAESSTVGHPGTPSGPPPELAEHPDYRIVRELGRGGMGVVYLAHNRLMARDEVLKVVGGHLIERKGVLDRFLREIRSAARLGHPNIVQAYSAFRVGPSVAFAMEYVEGLDLAKMVKSKGPLPVAHACSFVHQAALGLQHAHERGMVHRDIKPGNLMLSRKGDKAVVKVLDFGLAKATLENTFDGSLTNEGQMLGTPDFIAPEQIRDAQSADIRADIYSLGCSLYYLLTGAPPFQAALLYDLLQAHFSMDARPLNLARREVPAELAALVAKMMAKETDRRFQTPAEVAEALTPFFKKSAVAANAQLSTTDRPAPRRTEAVAGPKRPPAARGPWDDLVDSAEADRSPKLTEPLARRVTAERPRKPRWAWPVAAGLVVLGGLIALGFIIRIKSKDGEVVLSDPTPGTKVSVGPDKVDVVVNGAGPLGDPPAVEESKGDPPQDKPAVELEKPAPPRDKSEAVEEPRKADPPRDVPTVEEPKKTSPPQDPSPAAKTNTNTKKPGTPKKPTSDRMTRLAAMLEMPIPMHYPDGVTLQKLVDDIKKATKRPDGSSIPIYIDPIGLEDADKDMNSTTRLDLDGEPLERTLRLALEPLWLDYRIGEGAIYIGSVGEFRDGATDIVVVNSDRRPRSRAVLASLETPIPMRYGTPTPLRKVYDDLKQALKTPDGRAINIHVDRAGLEDADKDMNSTICMDLEGIPARVTLHWLLGQLGLDYFVEDGVLFITAGDWVARRFKR